MRDKNSISPSGVFEPYLSEEEVTREDVKEAYREAFLDLHPDHGGSSEEFMQVNDDRKRLLNEEMEEGVLYDVVSDDSPYLEQTNDKMMDEFGFSDKFFSTLRDYWEEGIREANYGLGSSYELVTFRRIEDHKIISRFEDSSELSFAINAEISGELFTHETNYFVEGENVDCRMGSRFSYEADSEEYLRGITEDAVEIAEALKFENKEFFDSL